MSDDGKLVNVNVDLKGLSGLSDGARILAQRLSDEIGAFTKPFHTKRQAQAKANAAIVKAETKNKITEIQERGLRRMIIEEGKRQENIEAISRLALPLVNESAKSAEIESDWISDFFEKGKLISDSEMQNLWGRLLAQEANTPKSVSKRSIALLATLDKSDAELFTKFCSFVWFTNELTPLILEINKGAPFNDGINFSTLKHLDAIGLISFEPVTTYIQQGHSKYSAISYYGRALLIEFPQDKNDFTTGHVMLTSVGKQLAAVCGSKPSETYYIETVEKLHSSGYLISSLISNKGF